MNQKGEKIMTEKGFIPVGMHCMNYEGLMLCPVCGYENVRPLNIEYDHEDRAYTISFSCEYGHGFKYRFKSCKDKTHITKIIGGK
jgi:hypothetical protein